jgi:glucose/arabinose dehydrogenase
LEDDLMAYRGRLLLTGVLCALLLACQSASAASSRPASQPSQPVQTKEGKEGSGQAAQAVAKPAADTAAARHGGPEAQPAAAVRQATSTVPQIALQSLPFGFRQPLFLTHAGDGSGRQFVVEKGGTIRIVKGDQVLDTPFLDLSSKVRSSGSEQGLLGLAFHPRYAENGRFFVGYTDSAAGRNTVERYQVSADPDQADPSTGVILLAIDDPAPNHNGGMVAFGPDGHLWVGTGDGGASGDRYQNAQNRQALLGKMLRLDVDGGEPYAIPADNPYVGDSAYLPEIWAMGIRNPWRYSFDRATGELWIGDVGQNAYEEIDHVPGGSAGGLNFGWPIMEGTHCFPVGTRCDPGPYVLPVAEYGRDGGCSVTGGYVYRGTAHPSLQGVYFFGDYCSGRIWSLDQQGDGAWRMTQQLQEAIQISSFGEDEAGEVYVTTFSGGNDGHRIYQIVAR